MGQADKSRTIKIIAAAVLGIAAAGVLAWNLGLFGGGAAPDPETEAAARRAAELQRNAEQAGFKEDEPAPTTAPPPGTGRRPFAPDGR